MQVEKVTKAEKGTEIEYPHPYLGKLVFTDESERGHNILTNFVEQIWVQSGGDDFCVGFSPTINQAVLWVNARTQEIVDAILKEVLEQISNGFLYRGVGLTITKGEV